MRKRTIRRTGILAAHFEVTQRKAILARKQRLQPCRQIRKHLLLPCQHKHRSPCDIRAVCIDKAAQGRRIRCGCGGAQDARRTAQKCRGRLQRGDVCLRRRVAVKQRSQANLGACGQR